MAPLAIIAPVRATRSELGRAIADLGRQMLWKEALALFWRSSGAAARPGDAPPVAAGGPLPRLLIEQASCGAALAACARGAVWQSALALLGAARRAELRPDGISLGTALGACAKAGRWPQVLALWAELSDLVPVPAGSAGGLTRGSVGIQQQQQPLESSEPGLEGESKAFFWSSHGVEVPGKEVPSGSGMTQAVGKEGLVADGLTCQSAEPSEGLSRGRSGGSRTSVVDHAGRGLTAAVAACGRAGEWRWALWLLETAPWEVQGLASFNAGLTAMATGQQWVRSLQLLSKMSVQRGLRPDVVSYSASISAMEKGQQWQRALMLLQEAAAENFALDVIVVNTAITACDKAAEWQWALALLSDFLLRKKNKIKNRQTTTNNNTTNNNMSVDAPDAPVLHPQVASFNAAAGACARGLQWERALWLLFREMPSLEKQPASQEAEPLTGTWAGQRGKVKFGLNSRGYGSRHLEPNLISLNTALSACAAGQQWSRALYLLLHEMPSRGLHPSLVSFGSSIAACEKADRCGYALALLSKMRQQVVEPNVVIFNSLITSCEKAALWERALELLGQGLRCSGPSVIPTGAAVQRSGGTGSEEEGSLGASGLKGPLPCSGTSKGGGLDRQAVVGFGAAIQACERAAEWRWAVALLSAAQAPTMEARTAQGQDAEHEPGAQNQGRKQQQQLRCLDAASLASVARACSRGLQWRHAVTLAVELEDWAVALRRQGQRTAGHTAAEANSQGAVTAMAGAARLAAQAAQEACLQEPWACLQAGGRTSEALQSQVCGIASATLTLTERCEAQALEGVRAQLSQLVSSVSPGDRNGRGLRSNARDNNNNNNNNNNSNNHNNARDQPEPLAPRLQRWWATRASPGAGVPLPDPGARVARHVLEACGDRTLTLCSSRSTPPAPSKNTHFPRSFITSVAVSALVAFILSCCRVYFCLPSSAAVK
ncbi:unnamed protein product [Polarella glacialis]|uniref:Pentatricopeptide repeat-containing protein, chloroplastic n=1 Tax=Polarella glacialis TaxID=89957 RepID=A0A813D1G2_POLGL|nr:unnamed protein product [Polarella glacialis]